MARAALAELDPPIDPDRLYEAQLLASELVTNAVKYSEGGSIKVEMAIGEDALRVEVVDDGHGFELRKRDRKLTEVGGWGLPLVEQLSDRWGVHEGSTHVWFEFKVQ